MRNRMRLIASLLALVCLAGCGEQAATAPELVEPLGVQADMEAAHRGELYTLAGYAGAVEPYVEELSFPVQGQVESTPGYSGKKVEQGETLILLDSRAEQERLEALQAEMEFQAQDNAYADSLAELEIERLRVELRQLWSSGAGYTATALKELEIEEKEALLRQTQELRQIALDSQQQELEKLQTALDNMKLTAPFAGRVVACTVEAGSGVAPYAAVAYLADDTRLSLSCEYMDAGFLASAHEVYAQIGGERFEIVPRPVDQEEYTARMLAGKEVRSYFDFADPEAATAQLESGQFAEVFVVTGYIEDALLVPMGAVLTDSKGAYVYVDNNGQRERRDVKTGGRNQLEVQIVEGLEEGEVVYVKD